jgi:hypothetical protein
MTFFGFLKVKANVRIVPFAPQANVNLTSAVSISRDFKICSYFIVWLAAFCRSAPSATIAGSRGPPWSPTGSVNLDGAVLRYKITQSEHSTTKVVPLVDTQPSELSQDLIKLISELDLPPHDVSWHLMLQRVH